MVAVPPGGRLGAELLRLLGTVLYAAGDLERAGAVSAEGIRAAEAAGLAAVGARIAVLQVEIGSLVTGFTPKAFAECEAAIAVLEAAGELAGLADAWALIGRMRLHSDIGPPGGEEALERALAYARCSENGRAELEATMWLVYLVATRRPADVGIDYGEQALAAAHGDPWNEAMICQMFGPLYAFVGQAARGRAALARSRAQFAKSGAGFLWAISAFPAGLNEMFAGDAAAAERQLRGGYQALAAMGEQSHRASITALLADAVYSQGRLPEAQQLADEAREIAVSGDYDPQVVWRAVSAKLLARPIGLRCWSRRPRRSGSPARAKKPASACGRSWTSTPNPAACPWPSGPGPRWPASASSPDSPPRGDFSHASTVLQPPAPRLALERRSRGGRHVYHQVKSPPVTTCVASRQRLP